MQWLHRVGGHTLAARPAPEHPPTEPAEHIAPGLVAFFDKIAADRSHAVLDLGPGAGVSLRVYSRFARWVRFADVLTTATSPAGWPEVLGSLPPHPERPFDLIIAWDVLDRLQPANRPVLVRRLAEISSPDARLFLLSASPNASAIGLPRCTLLEIDRIQYEMVPEARPAHPPILPAEVPPTIEPFRVLRAFTTRTGLRQYVAERS